MGYGIYPPSRVDRAINDLIRSLAIPIVRTIYINPTFAINGDGTTWTQAATPGAAGAFNAWGTGSWVSGAQDLTHFWRDNTRYLQAEVTTYGTTVVVYACVGCVFGTYDAATGEQIQDGARHAKIYAASGHGVNLGGFSATRRLFLFDNIDVRALVRTTSGNYPITGFAARDYRADIAIVRCILDGYTCSAITCAGLTYIGNGFYGYGDGIGGQTTLARAEFNTKLNDASLPINPAEFDGIAFQCRDSDTVESYVARNNDLRLAVGVTTAKQGVYFYNSNDAGTVATLHPTDATGPMVIERNLIRGANQGVLSMFNATAVLRNTIDDSIAWGRPCGAADAVSRAIGSAVAPPRLERASTLLRRLREARRPCATTNSSASPRASRITRRRMRARWSWRTTSSRA